MTKKTGYVSVLILSLGGDSTCCVGRVVGSGVDLQVRVVEGTGKGASDKVQLRAPRQHPLPGASAQNVWGSFPFTQMLSHKGFHSGQTRSKRD